MTATLQSVSIVEDDRELRESLVELIDSAPAWRVKSVFPDAEQALAGLAADPPTLVLMDIQLPGMSGIDCVARLAREVPDLQILMLTVYDNNDRIFDALAAGASGYLLKRDIPNRLLESLDELVAGGSPMSGAIARKVVQRFRRTPLATPSEEALTPRETEILELLVQGALYKEIAAELGIGVETVRTHLRNIYRKLHVRTRTEAVVKYLGH